MCEVAQKIPSEKNSPGKGDEQEIYILFRVIVTPQKKGEERRLLRVLTSDTTVFQWYIEFTMMNDLFSMVSNLLSYVTGQIYMPLAFFYLPFFIFLEYVSSFLGSDLVRMEIFRVINLNIRSAKEFHFKIHVIGLLHFCGRYC